MSTESQNRLGWNHEDHEAQLPFIKPRWLGLSGCPASAACTEKKGFFPNRAKFSEQPWDVSTDHCLCAELSTEKRALSWEHSHGSVPRQTPKWAVIPPGWTAELLKTLAKREGKGLRASLGLKLPCKAENATAVKQHYDALVTVKRSNFCNLTRMQSSN